MPLADPKRVVTTAHFGLIPITSPENVVHCDCKNEIAKAYVPVCRGWQQPQTNSARFPNKKNAPSVRIRDRGSLIAKLRSKVPSSYPFCGSAGAIGRRAPATSAQPKQDLEMEAPS
jgi:hypothetical protein